MDELTEDLPKCLMTVGSKTLLEHQIDSLHANGIQDITIIRGYQAEKIDLQGIRYFENSDYRENNVLHSLMYARQVMDDAFVATFSDLIYEDQVLTKALDAPNDISVVVDLDWRSGYEGREGHPIEEAAKVVLDDQGFVQTIGKQLDPSSVSGEFIGMFKCTKEGAKCFSRYFDRAGSEYDLEAPFVRATSFRNAYITDLLQYMVDDGIEVDSVPIQGGWQEIDVLGDLLRARERWGKTK